MKNIIYIFLLLLLTVSCGKIKEEPTNFKAGDQTYCRPFDGNITYYTNGSPSLYLDADGGTSLGDIARGKKLTYKGIERRPSTWIGKRGLKALVVVPSGEEGWIRAKFIEKRFDFSKGFHMASVFEYFAAQDLSSPTTYVFLFLAIVLWFLAFRNIEYDDYESVGFLYLLGTITWGFWGILAVVNQDLFLSYLYEPLQHLKALFVYVLFISLLAPLVYLIFLIIRNGFTRELIIATIVLPFLLFTSFSLAALFINIVHYILPFVVIALIVIAVVIGLIMAPGSSGSSGGSYSGGSTSSGNQSKEEVVVVYDDLGRERHLRNTGWNDWEDQYGEQWKDNGRGEYFKDN